MNATANSVMREGKGAMCQLHPFEHAGLGVAPFRCIGMERRVGPIRIEQHGATLEIGAPGQPMGTCQFCFTGIADCYIVQDANGKTFIVGCECVRKTADAKLVSAVRRLKNEADRERRHEKAVAVYRATRERLEGDQALRDALAAMPHPRASVSQFFVGKTRLDWADWMLKNAGMKGRDEVARFISSPEVNARA